MKKRFGVLFAVLLVCTSSATAYADLTDGLIAYWPFNGNANDKSGNGNHGICLPIQDGPTLAYDRNGNPNSAYQFDGANDYIDIGDNVQPPFPLTVSVWVNIVLKPYGNGVIIRNDYVTSITNGIMISYTSDGRVSCLFGEGYYSSSDRREKITDDIVLTEGNWHHIVARYIDGRDIDIWVDGVERTGYSTGMAYYLHYSSNNGAIGTEWYQDYFQGTIDDIRFYDRALSENEIQQLFNETTPGSCAGSPF